MTVWVKATALDDATEVRTEIEVPDGVLLIEVTPDQLARLLTEAGYALRAVDDHV